MKASASWLGRDQLGRSRSVGSKACHRGRATRGAGGGRKGGALIGGAVHRDIVQTKPPARGEAVKELSSGGDGRGTHRMMRRALRPGPRRNVCVLQGATKQHHPQPGDSLGEAGPAPVTPRRVAHSKKGSWRSNEYGRGIHQGAVGYAHVRSGLWAASGHGSPAVGLGAHKSKAWQSGGSGGACPLLFLGRAGCGCTYPGRAWPHKLTPADPGSQTQHNFFKGGWEGRSGCWVTSRMPPLPLPALLSAMRHSTVFRLGQKTSAPRTHNHAICIHGHDMRTAV